MSPLVGLKIKNIWNHHLAKQEPGNRRPDSYEKQNMTSAKKTESSSIGVQFARPMLDFKKTNM